MVAETRRQSAQAENHFAISSEPSSPTSGATSRLDNMQDMHLAMPTRPDLTSVNSSTALLGGQDVVSPLSPAEDPFRSRTSSFNQASDVSGPNSPEVHVATTNSAVPPIDSLSPPPKIHVNSIPNTPEQPDLASFNPRASFASPFASAHDMPSPTTLTHRKGSIATKSQLSYGATLDEADDDLKRTSAPTSFTNKFAQRRSLRAKAGKAKPKERDSRDMHKNAGSQLKRKPFESTRLKGEIYKPWLEKKDPAQRWARWITIASIIIGIGLCAFCECNPSSMWSRGATDHCSVLRRLPVGAQSGQDLLCAQ